MTPEEIPQHLVDILDQRAGKTHSRGGPVLAALAEILTAAEADMARSTYIYVATWGDHVGSSGPVAAATVKREFLDALGRVRSLDDLEVWRVWDGAVFSDGESGRTFLGPAAAYLAKERPS